MTFRPARAFEQAGTVIARRYLAVLTRRLAREPVLLALLLSGTVALCVAIVASPSTVSASVLVLPLLIGGLFLTPPSLGWVVTVASGCLLVTAATGDVDEMFGTVAGVVVIAALVSVGLARSRARLGLTGTMGESMLVDLRDRLVAQGRVPELPRGWAVDFVHRSAGRSSFSGDFIVATRSADGGTVELALVDVSGKGLAAGTRALLLSGAFGGLLGSLPPAQFLSAANAYLLRQKWSEGFATAVHLVVDLRSGRYEVRSAGHPPAIHFHAGSGRWATLDSEGGLLGVYEQEAYEPVAGNMLAGDALMLYTDGLVEAPRRDLSDGIDKLQGEAERLVSGGFRGGAKKLVSAVPSSDNDDRALLLLWRT